MGVENMNYTTILKTAFGNFIKSVERREKDENDMIYTHLITAGGAWEHWFKFELLSELYKDKHLDLMQYSITPETSYIDIVISKKHFSKRNKVSYEHECMIELKISSNWYLKDHQLDKIIYDIDKLERRDTELDKFLIVLNTFALPANGTAGWINDQINKGLGTNNEKEYLSYIKSYIGKHKKYIISKMPATISFPNEFFKKVILSGFIIKVK
ncbi:hypothetical protein ACFL20_10445 [Spirochaetota bacterium]